MRGMLVLLAAATAASAQTADEKAEGLWREYRSLGHGDVGRKEFQKREDVLFGLRDLPGEAGRPYLFKTLVEARRPDETVLSLLFLGAVRDMDHLEQATAAVSKAREEALIRILAGVLEKSSSDEVKRWVVEKGLASRDMILLGAACRAASSFAPGEAEAALEKLWPQLARGSKHDRIAFEAVRALGLLQIRLERPVLAEAFRHPSAAVRLGAAEALAGVAKPDDAAWGRIRALLKDPDWRVRKATIEYAGWSKNEALAADLIAVLEQDPRLTCRYAARAALRDLAGRDLDYDPAAWRAWLADRDAAVAGQPKALTFARYYGHQIVSDDICFVVDLSGSMRKGGKGTTRIDVARKELLRVLGQLDPKSRFNIVVFSDEAEAWKQRDVAATPRNIDAAKQWVAKTFEPGGQTNTYSALRMAFENSPDMDTIFLLSDGSPTMSDYESKAGILAAVHSWNWSRRVTIHTIALSLADILGEEKTDWGEDFMQQLASSTYGECRIVTKPPE